MLRHKFGSLRRRPRSSDENLDNNPSLERLNDCRMASFKYRRPTFPGDDSFNEINECSKSDSDFVEGKKPEGLNSSSSMESCTGSREHLPLRRVHSSLSREHSPLSREHSPLSREPSILSREHSPLSREPSLLSREQDHSDSDDSTTHHDSRPTSKLEGDVIDNNNDDDKRTISQQTRSCKDDATDAQLTRKKLGKRNSFTNAMKYFFLSKTR